MATYLITAKGWLCRTVRKVTGGLALNWRCVTDCGLSICGIKGWSIMASFLLSVNTLTVMLVRLLIISTKLT